MAKISDKPQAVTMKNDSEPPYILASRTIQTITSFHKSPKLRS